MHMIPIYCLSLSHIPPHTPTHTDTMLNVKNNKWQQHLKKMNKCEGQDKLKTQTIFFYTTNTM